MKANHPKAAPGPCLIKGAPSRSGRICRVPGGRHYDRTGIDVARDAGGQLAPRAAVSGPMNPPGRLSPKLGTVPACGPADPPPERRVFRNPKDGT